MAVITHLETDTGTNVDISGATAVGAYTANSDKLIMVDVSIDAVAGNGDYVMYVTRQIGGSGSAYRILPQTTMTAASGLTAISGQSGWITVRNGDVLTCYVDGLAGDTATPDWSTRWFELAGVTAAAVADAVWDEATADHTTASSFGALDANVDAILADTGTDGVVLKAAGLSADAVAEIADGVWDEAISGHTTATTFGGKNQKVVPSETIGDYKADVSALTNVTLTAAYDKAKDDVLTPLGVVDGIVDAIKVQTDKIPATPASAGEYNAALTAIQADLDNPTQYKADVSGLATKTDLQEVEDKVDGLATKSDIDGISILSEVVVGDYDIQDAFKIILAKLVGLATGGGTATITYRGLDDTSDVIIETVDSNGNRSAVTLTV